MDSQYKVKTLQGLDPTSPAIGGLLPRTPVRWAPVGAAMRAQDTIPATSRRIVAQWSLSGANDWAQPNGTANPGNNATPVGAQVYPDADWRTLASLRVHVTPGCELVAEAVCSPSGIAQKEVSGGVWVIDASWAQVRVGVTFTNGASSSGPIYKSASVEGAAGGTYTGLESSDASGNWTNSIMVYLGRIRPVGYTTTPATAATYSEWSDAQITIAIRGGARVQQVIVYEQPLSHVTLHSNSGLTSVHAMPASLAPQTPGPMTRYSNGATYQEHRFGTLRAMQVAERQSERLGPRIMHWNAWNESTISTILDTEADPVTTTSTSYVHLLDATITTYTADTPGWIVGAAHAQLARLSAPILIGRGEIAAVPVRVRVDASRAVANGIVRVQCGQYDWVDVTVTGGRAVYTATGYIESQIVADDDAWPMVVWIRSLAGGTLSVYNVSVDFGTWA